MKKNKILSFYTLFDNKVRGLLFVNIILMLVNTCLEFFGVGLLLIFLKFITDQKSHSGHHYLPFFFNLFGLHTSESRVIGFGVVLLSIYLLKILNNLLGQYLQSKLGFLVRSEAVSLVTYSFLNGLYSQTVDTNTYSLVGKMSYITQGISSYIKSICSFLINFLVAIALIGVLTLTIGLKAMGILGFLVVLGLIFIKSTKKFIDRTSKIKYDNSTMLGVMLSNIINGFRDIQLYRKENYFYKKTVALNDNVMKAGIKQDVITFIPNACLQTGIYIAIVIALVILYLSNINMMAVMPQAIITVIALQRLMGPASVLTTLYSNFKQNSYSIDSFLELVEASRNCEKLALQNEDKAYSTGLNKLECHIPSFKYDKTASFELKQIDFTLLRGKIYAFIGKSGSGKSTILSILLGFQPADSVDISINEDIHDNSLKDYRVGYVPQSPYILDANIIDNIAFGEEEVDHARLNKAVKDAQIDDFIMELPAKFKTQIGEDGAKLSGGQRQRIALARALYFNPEMLIIDESTSALDIHTEQKFYDTLEKLKQDMIILIISHRIRSLQFCDELSLIHDGQLLSRGSYNKISHQYFQFVENKEEIVAN